MNNLLTPLTTIFQTIEDKINFIILLFEGFILIIILLICIWIYGFVRKNLGIDKQTKELIKIRKLLEKKNKKEK
jgi:hypothetical protein